MSRVRVGSRHVEVEHLESPLLSLTLQHRSRVGVVLQFSSSHLLDFTGILYLDSNSNLQLELSLVEAAGTISGVVRGLGRTSQSFLLRLGQVRGNSSQQVSLAGGQCGGQTVEVRLRPLALLEAELSRHLPCLSQAGSESLHFILVLGRF